MGQAIWPLFRLQDESLVVKMKGFLGTGVTYVKENLFPTLFQSREGCSKPGGTEQEGQCAYSKAFLTVAFNHGHLAFFFL